MIEIGEWGRGFRSFGETVRESSAASWPMAWVDNGDGDEDHLPLEQVEALGTEDAYAFVAFVECTANPRWLDYEQPPRTAIHDESDGLAWMHHRLGYYIWLNDGNGWTARFTSSSQELEDFVGVTEDVSWVHISSVGDKG